MFFPIKLAMKMSFISRRHRSNSRNFGLELAAKSIPSEYHKPQFITFSFSLEISE